MAEVKYTPRVVQLIAEEVTDLRKSLKLVFDALDEALKALEQQIRYVKKEVEDGYKSVD